MSHHKKVVLKSRPKGKLRESDLAVVPQDIVDESGLEDGSVLVASSLLSVDAFIRTMLDEAAYHGSTQPGETLMALGVGTVVASKSPKFKVGSRVAGALGAQSIGPVKAEMIQPCLKLPGVPESASLGLLGLTSGMTAWVGINAVLKPPKRNELVVVSAAAGAVGSAGECISRVAQNKIRPQAMLYFSKPHSLLEIEGQRLLAWLVVPKSVHI